MTIQIKTIADLVTSDYNGEPLPYDANKRNALVEDTLRMWCKNSPKAKVLIDGMGIQDAIEDYIEEWDAAHEDEYGTGEESDAED